MRVESRGRSVVGLVNTNRYLEPPVIPIGLEHLVKPLEDAGHSVRTCDLAFDLDPVARLVSFIEETGPDTICLSFRNVDTAIYYGNRFLLEEGTALVDAARSATDVPLVAGGSATLCSGEELRSWLGVDCLVTGPGERALPALLEGLAAGAGLPPLVDGWKHGIDSKVVHSRGNRLDYGPYLDKGGLCGLEWRKGCDWKCPFCVERTRPVLAREASAVVSEAGALVDRGVSSFFLCDSEVNLDLRSTNQFLKELAESGLGIEWTGYFKPVPFNRRMAKLLSASGLHTLTLSVNSWDLQSDDSAYDPPDVVSFCQACREHGIKVAVDLLLGYPEEGRDSMLSALECLERAGPATVGVSSFFRLYAGTPVTRKVVSRHPAEGIVGAVTDNPGLLRPVFFCQVDQDWLKDQISPNPLFVLEGTESTVNYQRT